MIEELRLRNVGVIEDVHLTFGRGLSVLTGETGAGKTMVLTGLGLLMGRRADPQLVRQGSAQGEVEGLLSATDESELAAWAERSGGALDDGALLVGRVVPVGGRARAFLGGRSVPAAVLGELAEHYVTVHGQADQQRLRSPVHQRAALDGYAGLEDMVARYRLAYETAQRRHAELRDWDATARRIAAERAELTAGLQAIDRVEPQAGEDDELRARAERLANIEDLREAVETAYTILSGAGTEPGAVDQLTRAGHALNGAARYDRELGGWAELVGEANSLLSQTVTELGIHRAELEADPQLLDAVHARRADINALVRRFGPTLDDVLRWAEAARARLAELDGGADSRDAVEDQATAAQREAEALAAELSTRRADAGRRLATAVNHELAGLAMKTARLTIGITPAGLGPWGGDDVAMVLAPHPGAAPLPVATSASGGELSRIMLALEVSLAARPDDHTFVFDEVDAGVGGSAAVEVGRRLKELSRHHQVVVVTHLAQVAAFADHHLVVTKAATGGAPTTRVERVVGAARERELARMLAGDESPTALRHAAELLHRAGVGP